MSKRSLLATTLAALVATAACSDSSPPPPADENAAAAQTDATMPRNPHVMAIDLGFASDDQGRIIGGGVQTFPAADTLHVSVRTQYVEQGTSLSVSLGQGGSTLETVTATVGASDPSGEARTVAVLPRAATLAPGTYRIEVHMNDASQGIREFTVGTP